jgi:serine protease AprX
MMRPCKSGKKNINALLILLLLVVTVFSSRLTAGSATAVQVLPDGIVAVDTIIKFSKGQLCKALFKDNKIVDIILYLDKTYEIYDPAKHSNLFPKDKISIQLKEKIDKAVETDQIMVGVWLTPVDYEKIDKEVKEELKIDDLEKETATKIKQYITDKRAKSKEAYTTKNEDFIAKNLNKETVIFTSKYAPFIIVNLTKKDIEKLNNLSDVKDLDLFVNAKKEDETGYSIPNINANYTRDTLNLKGAGVKVGIVESGYPNKTNSQLSDRSITFDIPDSEASSRLSTHATIVTSIIVGKTQGIAPNASIYAVGALSRLEDYQKIEWLIDQGVVVINYSAGYSVDRGTYSDMAKWIDHLGNQHNVHFVKSAGNTSSSNTLISDPGMAYNAIVTGSMYDHDSSSEPYWTDDTLSTFSCYSESSGGYKPDFTAPGQGITIAGYSNYNGTSFAAPHVTGVLAQLIGYRYNLTAVNSCLKALLAAGTTHKTSVDYGDYALSPDYSNKEGAGVGDAKGSYNCISGDTYTNQQLSVSQFPYQRTFTVSTTARPVRVSLTWLKQNTISAPSHPGAAVTERLLSDLDLEVYAPNGALVAYSVSAVNNVELVDFTPTVTGTYTLRVVGYTLQNDTEWISLAWYQ